MTTHHSGSTTTTPEYRVARVVGEEVRHTHAGRLAIPLVLHRGGDHVADLPLVVTADEAAELHAQIGRLLPVMYDGEET